MEFDVFWSMRSSYCYLALDRLLEIDAQYDVTVNIRIVYPVAIRNSEFFKDSLPKYYRSYHTLDSQRIADHLNIDYRRPIPDPIVQDMTTSEVAESQPYIYRLTRLAMYAETQGKALDFLNHVARLIWDGKTDNWHEVDKLAQAMTKAGIEAEQAEKSILEKPEYYDSLITANETLLGNAGHAGVPLFVFKDEPFFGQDRIDALLWRMKQHGLSKA